MRQRGWLSSRSCAGSWAGSLLVVAAGKRRPSTFALVGATGKRNVRRRRHGDGTRGVRAQASPTGRPAGHVSAPIRRAPCEESWRRHPDGRGSRMHISPLEDRARSLCDESVGCDDRGVTRSGRREGYPSRPPTPPCVRFRTRRFKCSAADLGVESEGSGVPTPQASDCSRPHACARPPRSTRRSPGGGGLARTRSLESFQGCSQVLFPQHLLQQRLGLWSDRVRARQCRLTHESRLMATSGRLLPGSLGRLRSHDCASVGTRDHGIGPGSRVRASGRCDDPSALC